jgi:hypothetical protein
MGKFGAGIRARDARRHPEVIEAGMLGAEVND